MSCVFSDRSGKVGCSPQGIWGALKFRQKIVQLMGEVLNVDKKNFLHISFLRCQSVFMPIDVRA